MDETKKTKEALSIIEKKLLHKEQEKFKEELKEALNKVNSVIKKYTKGLPQNIHSQNDLNDIKQWFSEYVFCVNCDSKQCSLWYRLYDYAFPKQLNINLLNNAVDDFLEKVKHGKEEK